MKEDKCMKKDTKSVLPEEGSISREDFLTPKSTTEVVLLYSFRVILGIAFLIIAVNAYHMAGIIGVILFCLIVVGSVYALLLRTDHIHESGGSFDRIIRHPWTYFMDEKVRTKKKDD